MTKQSMASSRSCSHHNAFFSILLSFSLIISASHIAIASSSSSSSSSTNTLETYKAFIKDYCNSTTYPKNCYKYLSPYASIIKTSPLVLTKSSIYLALKQTSKSFSALKLLSKVKGLTRNETLVIKDCVENIYDSLDEVKQSAIAVKGLTGGSTSDEAFQWSNIKTWMSAAITSYTTCTDEFDEMKISDSLQKKITSGVSKAQNMVSNALSVVNKFTDFL
ncbi:21 kDa protein-like [Prosopis cineraria]|uniref:21 kDa protein-like n=1 Tax=Prosopis cineraria TaxID=364024 RepID=UPI00240FBE0E|nr:21 kDa protein-like [Prosopis cineraria]